MVDAGIVTVTATDNSAPIDSAEKARPPWSQQTQALGSFIGERPQNAS
jgi:hypothetical protein